ncbi:hypothetical protein CUJ84_pRLN2000157 (plasmid) [Rhizobium leguminosarum]|uniref:Uncharacterized protein n=1 Tax=Rhizobium leguminosarum TaxID=384 RepID=A0A2K9ZEN0_RHILE|nr:hypothetical protein CUJ84_pRLN2000157 [Rhizobium leguminosarum]
MGSLLWFIATFRLVSCYLFVFTQFRTKNHYTLLLELL